MLELLFTFLPRKSENHGHRRHLCKSDYLSSVLDNTLLKEKKNNT